LRFQEWDYLERDFGDTTHALEDISYLVLKPGRYAMSDGSVWEVGTFAIDGTINWQSIQFSEPFDNPPHLFLTVQTYNGAQAATIRARNVSANGFESALFEEEALNDGHATETVGYVAIYSPSNGGLIDQDVGQVPYTLQTLDIDSEWTPAFGQQFKVEEEQSLDNEVKHTFETVHVLAVGNQIYAQQVSDFGGNLSALRRME